jgi:hypothetical protein
LPVASHALLNWAGCSVTETIDLGREREKGINLLTDTLETCFNFPLLDELLNE